MTPYATFTYFGVLLYPALPALVLGLIGRLTRSWILLATAMMLVIQYSVTQAVTPGTAVPEIGLVVSYAALQWAVALGLLWARRRGWKHWPFYLALSLALAPLAAVKLLPSASLLGFLGISYVTFRGLDVVIGIQDGLIPSVRPLEFFSYLLFFPTISAGPIDRYRRFTADARRARSRAEVMADLDGAVKRIFLGFLYKFILAALVKQYWLDPAASAPGLLATVSYMYAYSLYLFFDFAGYSAFAIGVAYLFGIRVPENFQRPFLARNIRDFWNRWHISLSFWFRDHVYMRFLMAAMKRRWFPDKHLASYSGLVISFGLMGLWHGTQAHYLLYGLYHAGLLVAHDLFGRWNAARGFWGNGPLWQGAGVVVTFNLVCFGFLLFSGHLI